ncbi:MAG: N-acetylmuramoyl-L-alanine amidase, partial [Gemmatimonadota bacterium]|nr:N-acetylmuramoyl-L-alanine amidase [Gemmatimonadota bacterium]
TVRTASGEVRVPVRIDASGAPVLAAPVLAAALGGSVRPAGEWRELTIGGETFRFLPGAPLFTHRGRVEPLAGAATTQRDTLLVPLQFVAEALPDILDRYRYDRRVARLVDGGAATTTASLGSAGPRPQRQPAAAATQPAQVTPKPAASKESPAEPRLSNGLRPGHLVTIDAGHGGVDPGNPGQFFPKGVREKDVTLQVSLLLRDELRRRGVGVRLTRATDTLIDLGDRGKFCSQNCDLFVSIHVNSLPKRPGYTNARGFETYFLAEAKTEEAARVERMENEAVRFEAAKADEQLDGIDFILKDLQLNEHLRESARAAELVQAHVGEVHTGPDRGVKQAGFKVLTTARRPAILVELGYSTNPEDAKLMSRREGQVKLAEALADAIVTYLKEYERKIGAAADTGVAQ